MNCDLFTILMKAKKGFQLSDSTPLEFNIKARSGGVVEQWKRSLQVKWRIKRRLKRLQVTCISCESRFWSELGAVARTTWNERLTWNLLPIDAWFIGLGFYQTYLVVLQCSIVKIRKRQDIKDFISRYWRSVLSTENVYRRRNHFASRRRRNSCYKGDVDCPIVYTVGTVMRRSRVSSMTNLGNKLSKWFW